MNRLERLFPRETKRGKSAQGVCGGLASLVDGIVKIGTLGFKDPAIRLKFAMWCAANWKFVDSR